MCFYITATLPEGTQVNSFRKILDEYHLAFTQVNNPLVVSQLRPGELYLRATKSYCDCDTVLGSLNSLQDFQKLSNSKKVKTLRKKKWSEEEISMWINDRLKAKQDKKKNKHSPIEESLKSVAWIKFLHSLLDKKVVSRVGLLKHWYTKGLTDEDIKLKKTERITVNNLTREFLLNIEEDVLYEFLPVYQF
ncbi:MAG: hypothetical protein ACW986_07015 [Promethearchaeota archaeon]|jgi:hypothetical protein